MTTILPAAGEPTAADIATILNDQLIKLNHDPTEYDIIQYAYALIRPKEGAVDYLPVYLCIHIETGLIIQFSYVTIQRLWRESPKLEN